MKHWDDESRAEYETAVAKAWNAGSSDRDRTLRFLKILKDAEQAQRGWASDVLTACEWDGVWRRLKDDYRAAEPLTLSFAGATHAVPRIGGVARRKNGVVQYEQVPFVDMTRDELIDKQKEYEATSYAARRNKHLMTVLIELIDSATGCATPRQAASQRGVDVDDYVAGAA